MKQNLHDVFYRLILDQLRYLDSITEIETYKKFSICIPLVAPEMLSSTALFLLEELVIDDVLGARKLSRRKLLMSAASN